MPHDKYIEERSRERANVASHLHAALQHIQQAFALNQQFALGINVPEDSAIVAAIHHCAHLHQQETEAQPATPHPI